ncbi:MAG: hypothetical protein OXI33_04895 [Chloroflexota bacterium]|nr:hypothetical protein [Chloroflexota bacterium]
MRAVVAGENLDGGSQWAKYLRPHELASQIGMKPISDSRPDVLKADHPCRSPFWELRHKP